MLSGESRHFTFRDGFTNLEFWAERGMISLVDADAAQDSTKHVDEYHQRLAPGTFMARAIAALVHEPDKYPDKLQRLRKLVQDAKECCLEAKRFGDPTDPSVLEHVIKHQRKNRIVMPHELPQIPVSGLAGVNYKLSGTRSASQILTKGYEVAPDFTVTPRDRALVEGTKLIKT